MRGVCDNCKHHLGEKSCKGCVWDIKLQMNTHWEPRNNMDNKALDIVRSYVLEHLDKSDEGVAFDLYIVWKAKVLQNWKYLISTTLIDGMYYEITFNGDNKEWYLDAYKKFENRVIAEK